MLTMAERNIRSPLLRTPRASLSTSRSGRSSHLVLARAKPSRVPLAEPLVAGDLDTALPGLEEGLGRLREVHFFPADLLEHGLGQGLVHEESPDEMGSGMEPLLPVPRGEGAVGGLVRTEVLGGLARHRTVQVGGADVGAGVCPRRSATGSRWMRTWAGWRSTGRVRERGTWQAPGTDGTAPHPGGYDGIPWVVEQGIGARMARVRGGRDRKGGG